MKTIKTILLIITLLCGIMPATAEVNFTEKTYFISEEYDVDAVLTRYYNTQDDNGITLTTSSKKQKNIANLAFDNITATFWWSSTAVDSTASDCGKGYVQIYSKNEDIKKVRILSVCGNPSYASQFIVVGWKKDSPISNIADYSSYQEIDKKASLQWYTIDLSGCNGIRTIRIYSAINCDMYVGETNIDRGMGSYRRPYIYGIQVGLSSNSTTIGPYGFAAFSSTSALDFTNVTDCNAYYADSYANGTLHLTKATGVVPANFGLLLCAPEGTTTSVCIPVATAEQLADCKLTADDNVFVATSNTPYTPYTPASSTDALALGVKDSKAGFYYVGEGVAVPQNKMYLPAAKVGGAKSVTLDFGGIDPTGIVNVSSDDAANIPSAQRPATDLLGRPVTNPMPGQIYIKDGKAFKLTY